MTFERMRAWTAGALLSTALSTTLASMSPALAQVTPVDEDLVKDGDLDSVMATPLTVPVLRNSLRDNRIT